MSTTASAPAPDPRGVDRAVPRPDPAPRPAQTTRDPWVISGLVLLVVLSWAAVTLYRGGPQSASAVRDRVWLAARPDAFSPRIAEAERLLRQAGVVRQAGELQAMLPLLVAAASEADRARDAATTDAQTSRAVQVWSEATLQRAAVMVELGSAPWWRGDNDRVLTGARTLVDRVLASAPSQAVRARAEALRGEIIRKLRPGPLEWLPSPR